MMQKRTACIRGEKCQPLTFKARLNCTITHHPKLSSVEIADRTEIQHARLMAYASESQPNDHIPFKALMRVCVALDAWDLIDAELDQYSRRLTMVDAPASTGDAINEAIDISTKAASVLAVIRDMRKGGIDSSERVQLRNMVREIHAECDELSACLDEPRLRAVGDR